jgi:MFS family permease
VSGPSTAATPTISKPALARWRWAVTAAFALGGITGSAWGPRLPAIEADLHVGTATIGLLLAGVTVGAIIGLLSSTPVLHLLGSRRALAGALLLIAAALGLMSLALAVGWVPLLAVAFVITGSGIGILDVLINVEGTAVEQATGRTLMPRMHAAWSIGTAAGSGIGAACAALSISPAAQFTGEAVIIAAAAFGTASGIPRGERESAEAARPRRRRADALRQWARGWLDWRLLLIGLVMLGCELGEGGANSWLPLAARNGHGRSAAVAALFLTAFAICEALTRMFAGPVIDRLGRVRTIQLTTALGVAGIVAFILGGNVWIAIGGVVLWAVGVSMGFPLGMSAAAESGPNPAARISVVASIGYFANIAGPPVIGALAQSAGLLNALWIIAVLFVAAFCVAGSFRPRTEPPLPAPGGNPPSELPRATDRARRHVPPSGQAAHHLAQTMISCRPLQPAAASRRVAVRRVGVRSPRGRTSDLRLQRGTHPP